MPAADYKRFLGFLKQHDCHLPFKRFRTPQGNVVDSVLGPEMRSTGEVMASAADFATAFGKAERAAGRTLPRSDGAWLKAVNDQQTCHAPRMRGIQ